MRGLSARRSRRAAVWTSIVTLGFAVAACASNAPQDTLKPVGPVAIQEDNLFKPVFWIAAAVFFLVEGGLIWLMIRYRRRSDADAPKQIHGNKRLEIIWTIIPATLLAAISIPVVLTIFDVAAKPVGSNVVHVNVTGHQWWWEYEYTDFKTADGTTLKTANELVIPTGRWVYLTMTSKDVIHSFWIPKLAGKQDVIPGRTTYLKLRSDIPGTYRGQCAEFCAISHANMRARAIAEPPDAFNAWVARQLKPAPMPQNPEVTRIFQSICLNCHTVRGIPNVSGIIGPDLTHLGDRKTFAGASFDLTAANLARWMDDPSAMKPLWGAPFPNSLDQPSMPDYNLTKEQIDAIVAYLMITSG